MFFIVLMLLVFAFTAGVVLGPKIHDMIRIAQEDDQLLKELKRGEAAPPSRGPDGQNGGSGRTQCFPNTKAPGEPLISEDDYWTPRPKKKRKSKRKGQ